MESLNPEMIQQLRKMARDGTAVPQMLREIIRRAAPEQPHAFTLMQYLRVAFDLSLRQASPIGGWRPDGAGEVGDAQLDEFLLPEITNNRWRWDAPEATTAP